MKALYRLKHRIAGFDFFPWLVMQAHAGATEIVFDVNSPKTNKWDLQTVGRRFESILLPGPALLGMPCSIGTEGMTDLAPYHQKDFLALSNDGIQWPRLRSVFPPEKERYTVTLRRTGRWPEKNSNEAAWLQFADEIGARVIPDYEDKEIHLHERMALYAGAEMNFFVRNGPGILCMLSDYPGMFFGWDENAGKGAGLPYGERYSFMRPQHHLIYEPDTLANIRRHFYAWEAQSCSRSSRVKGSKP
jgi:hypothetical protein